MSPIQAKVAVVAFGLLSLALVAAAVREWSRGVEPDQPAPAAGWARDRALWVGVGGFLAVMTLTRPWWFWENWRARGLRNLIGDEVTAFLYLVLAAVMVWVGLFTDWTFGRR